MKKRTFFPQKGQSYSLLEIDSTLLIKALEERYKIPHIAKNLFFCSKETLYKYCKKNNIDFKQIYKDAINKHE
jgi:hypothetical protein